MSVIRSYTATALKPIMHYVQVNPADEGLAALKTALTQNPTGTTSIPTPTPTPTPTPATTPAPTPAPTPTPTPTSTQPVVEETDNSLLIFSILIIGVIYYLKKKYKSNTNTRYASTSISR
jgi:type V secretory pathway adhesin AidA